MSNQEHRMSTADDFANIVYTLTGTMSEERCERLRKAIDEIVACEGTIPSQHWCDSCAVKLLVISRLLRLYRKLG